MPLIAFIFILTVHSAAAMAQSCRLALSLGLDVSASVDLREYNLQIEGLARAFESEGVSQAILADPKRSVALHIYEWSGRRNQKEVLGWTNVVEAADLAMISATLRSAVRSQTEFPTSLGSALGFGAVALQRAPACDRYTLDISGDGPNNDGFAPIHAYAGFDFSDMTVNGLAIGGADAGIFEYYLSEVIRGPGAFVEFAMDYDDFARAIERKLIRELGEQNLAQNHLQKPLFVNREHLYR